MKNYDIKRIEKIIKEMEELEEILFNPMKAIKRRKKEVFKKELNRILKGKK